MKHSFLTLFMIATLSLCTACSSGEQQVIDRPDEQQQVAQNPDEPQQVVVHPNSNEQQNEPQQVVVGPDGSEQSPSDEMTDDIFFSLQISINPSFELQVNNEEQIIALIPRNADGEALCRDINVVDTYYLDGLTDIIEQAHVQGFLEDGDKIDIQMTFRQASEQTIFGYNMSVHKTIEEYAQDHQMMNLEYSGGSGSQQYVANEDPQWTPEHAVSDGVPESDSNSDSRFNATNIEILERDSAGNVIHYLEHHDDHTREFFLNANGIETKMILTVFNGTIITHTFYSDGTLAQQITVTPEGEHITALFDSNGMMQSEEVLTTQGTKITSTFHPNGRQATQIITEPDGSQTQRTYSEDGLTMVSLSPNGRETVETYYQDGTIASRKADYGSSILEEYYDTNGELTYSVSTNNGTRVETFFNADRSGHMVTYAADGSSHSVYFRPDGKVTHGYDSNGNYYEETGAVYAGTKNGGKG